MATDIATPSAASRNDLLVDADLVRKWLAWGFVWLLIFPTVGALISTKFNYPEFLGGAAALTFGRLRPIHVNGVIWGAFSTLFIGLCHYLVPRLCGVRLWGERFSYPLYDLTYDAHVKTCLGWMKRFRNFHSTGRQGLFQYGNMDHSIAMGLVLAERLLRAGTAAGAAAAGHDEILAAEAHVD